VLATAVSPRTVRCYQIGRTMREWQCLQPLPGSFSVARLQCGSGFTQCNGGQGTIRHKRSILNESLGFNSGRIAKESASNNIGKENDFFTRTEKIPLPSLPLCNCDDVRWSLWAKKLIS